MPPARPGGRHLASSPFQPEPERVVERYAAGDRVSHDAHGLGVVISVDPHGVSVDFGGAAVRVPSPFVRMEKL